VDDNIRPIHWSPKKWIHRCAARSTVTSVLPKFKQKTSDDVTTLYVSQIKCSKVTRQVADIPVKCDWYPTICPDGTVYIQGIRKQVTDNTPHFEHNCCVNKNACNTLCQDKKATLKSNERVFYYPQQQMDSDQRGPAIVTIMFQDVSGQATMEWKFCENTTMCYTPPPGGPGGPGNANPPGNALGLLGLLGLLALLALIGPSSTAAPVSSTVAG